MYSNDHEETVKNESQNPILNKIKHSLPVLYLIVYDILAVHFSFVFALLLRFDFAFSKVPHAYLGSFFKFAPFYTVFVVCVFACLRLYDSLWRFASYRELNRIITGTIITGMFHVIFITLFVMRMPISYYLTGIVAQFLLTTFVRFSYRFINLERNMRRNSRSFKYNVMIIGAGNAGQIIIRELHSAKESDSKACCIIDDDPMKRGRQLDGVPVVGNRENILENIEKYHINKIIYAIPSSSTKDQREILNICKESNCEIKKVPGVYQLASDNFLLSKLKSVEVEDLLGRETIKTNLDHVFDSIKGKVVLITGGGGSIGSEIARQVAGHMPQKLVLFDIYENNLYDIEQELKSTYPNLDLVALVGSVRDSRRIDWVFKTYRPNIVYHAAAHKHVPLMETSPNEAIKNNVIGTYKTAFAALKYKTNRFVLISTDKAVNPTNIMGASKRLCEMVIQSMDKVSREHRYDLLPLIHAHETKFNEDDERSLHKSKRKTISFARTEFVAVRFGNVLGSNGSVIPLFKKQIEKGGPVTVTHPDIVRYFMTIPEAVSLVLQAGVQAKGGEIFVLDMGEPVKIDTLARNLIRLSGYTPDEDIRIVYSGLRPGEKLFEEKLMEEEGLAKTENDLIYIGKPIPFESDEFFKGLEKLAMACYENSPNIVAMVEDMVGTFHPVGEQEVDFPKVVGVKWKNA